MSNAGMRGSPDIPPRTKEGMSDYQVVAQTRQYSAVRMGDIGSNLKFIETAFECGCFYSGPSVMRRCLISTDVIVARPRAASSTHLCGWVQLELTTRQPVRYGPQTSKARRLASEPSSQGQPRTKLLPISAQQERLALLRSSTPPSFPLPRRGSAPSAFLRTTTSIASAGASGSTKARRPRM